MHPFDMVMLALTAEQDGHPPLGWSDTLAYLVLPVLLVVSQYISVQIMQSTQVCCYSTFIRVLLPI